MWYEWNFGDGSKCKNIIGFSNVENIFYIFFYYGIYNVSVVVGNIVG